MIPCLDPGSGLLSPGRHICSADEVELAFVKDTSFFGSATRPGLLGRLEQGSDCASAPSGTDTSGHVATGTTGGSAPDEPPNTILSFRRTPSPGADIWRCFSVTTPSELLAELRQQALAADIEPISDPAELARQSVRAHLEDIGEAIPPDRSQVDVRLHGAGITGHEVPVRQAMTILTSLQESVASIGQALSRKATVSGPINATVLKSTELRMSPELVPGSVIFQLTGPGEQLSGAEAAALTGSETLVDAAMRALFAIAEHAASAEDLEAPGSLARELRRFGPRAAKHLAVLTGSVVNDEIDLDLAWRTPSGRRYRASIQAQFARTIRDAIKLNEIATQRIELTGVLTTISTTKKAELRTQEQGTVFLAVSEQLAPSLGPFFNQNVIVVADETTKWSTNTGRETRSYEMRGIRPAAPEV
jgi:hypothetical protein